MLRSVEESSMSHHKHRSVRDVVHELRLPAPERAAARSERRAEAAIRTERDNQETAERRAAAVEAESRRYGPYGHL
jgi:hypothetical protein